MCPMGCQARSHTLLSCAFATSACWPSCLFPLHFNELSWRPKASPGCLWLLYTLSNYSHLVHLIKSRLFTYQVSNPWPALLSLRWLNSHIDLREFTTLFGQHTRYQEGLLRVPVHTLHIPTMPCLNIHQNPNPIRQLAPLLFICNNSTKQGSISHGYKPMVKGMPICSSDKCPRCTLQKYELVRKGILGTRISRIATCDYWHHLADTAMKWIWALRKKAPINWSSMYCQLMCLKDAFKSTG
jgi:hypothetical protein